MTSKQRMQTLIRFLRSLVKEKLMPNREHIANCKLCGTHFRTQGSAICPSCRDWNRRAGSGGKVVQFERREQPEKKQKFVW
jgi:lipopolysaccharide biosynthesis regulator YciM